MGESAASYAQWAARVGFVSVAISLAVQIALLTVAPGPVRRHRPDVSGTFALGAAIMLLATAATRIVATRPFSRCSRSRACSRARRSRSAASR